MTDTPDNTGAAVPATKTSRRKFLTAIGMVAGSDTLYQAMTTLGYGAETQFTGAPDLSGARPGSSVLVIGAGLAGIAEIYGAAARAVAAARGVVPGIAGVPSQGAGADGGAAERCAARS